MPAAPFPKNLPARCLRDFREPCGITQGNFCKKTEKKFRLLCFYACGSFFPKISLRVACEIFGNAVRGGGARFFARGIATERRRDDRTFDRVCKCARTNRPIGGYIDNSEFPCYHNDDHLQGEIVQLCQSIRKGVWDEKIYFRDSSLLCVCRWFVYRIGRGTDVVRSRLKKRKILCR